MTPLSTKVNPRQPSTLSRNTIHNTRNQGNCMVVNTRGSKQTIDTPMFSIVKGYMRKKDDVQEYSGKLGVETTKIAELSQKVVPIPTPPQQFQQKLVTNTKIAEISQKAVPIPRPPQQFPQKLVKKT